MLTRSWLLAGLALLVSLGSARAQYGMGDGAVPGVPGAGTGDEIPDQLAARSGKRIVIVDNLFFGISGLDELASKFRRGGWRATYAEDTYVEELFKLAQNTDILYIVTHAGVRERDQQVGFVWRTLLGVNKNVLTADIVAARMAGKPHPALVIVAGCSTTQNDSMAKAFGGAYIGFSSPINPASAATWCHQVLEKIAAGKGYREAYRTTPPIISFLNEDGGGPKLIEPAAAE